MRQLLIFAISFLLSTVFLAQGNPNRERVSGHRKKNGTYVAPHNRSQKNHTQKDNWSAKPNRNPDSGRKGYKKPKR